MNIAFIGYGNVGAPLADHLQRQGHTVTLATSGETSESLRKAITRNPALLTAPPKQALAAADVVFLATPFQANAAALAGVAAELNGKVLVDCTNPVGPGLTHGLGNVRSGSEAVQEQAPGARVVKAFTIYGFENFENSAYPGYGVKPAMLLCGDDTEAKRVVSQLASELGWEPVDTGGIAQALHLEHMTLLWIRMVRVHGASPNIVWAALRR